MPRTDELGFVSAIKDAEDEQPNDRQRQRDKDRRQLGSDNYFQHEYPHFHFLHFTSTGQLFEQKIERGLWR